jgi:hypothetical protein
MASPGRGAGFSVWVPVSLYAVQAAKSVLPGTSVSGSTCGRAVALADRALVSLLPLGPLLSAARPFAPLPPPPSTASRLYFSGTRHTLSGPFLAYWQAHQGSALLGAPIGEPEQEGLGDREGRAYLVQWFTNGRLELHPEVHDPRYRVLPGRVGDEYLPRHCAGWSKSPRSAQPVEAQFRA